MAEVLSQDAQLSDLHGHDQGDRLVIRLERRLLPLGNSAHQINRPPHDIAADRAGSIQFLGHNRSVQRMSEKFVAASQDS
jgi:hypothetical protein